MTVGELVKELSRFDPEQYAFVCLSSPQYPGGVQVIIQGIREVPPWRPGFDGGDPDPDGRPNLVGIVADAENALLGKNGGRHTAAKVTLPVHMLPHGDMDFVRPADPNTVPHGGAVLAAIDESRRQAMDSGIKLKPHVVVTDARGPGRLAADDCDPPAVVEAS